MSELFKGKLTPKKITEAFDVLPKINGYLDEVSNEGVACILSTLLIYHFIDSEMDEEDIRSFIQSTLYGLAQLNGECEMNIKFVPEES